MAEEKDRMLVERQQAGALAIPGELSVEDVVAQVQKIQKLMSSVMHEGEHYGKLPGTDKPCLFQPGAQKLNFVFRLGDRNTRIEQVDLPHGHREYRVTLDIVHIPSGLMLAQGVGSCSTMEAKYRWRKQYTETEVGAVPKEYWNAPREEYNARQGVLIGKFGAGAYKIKKTGGKWVVLRIEGDGERIENPDLADTYNTVLKMAHKRAYVYGTIKATAASDLFTQDLEDMVEPEKNGESKEEPKENGKKNSVRQDLINEIAVIVEHEVFADEDRNRIREAIKGAKTNKQLVEIKTECEKELEEKSANILIHDDGTEEKLPQADDQEELGIF